MDKHTENIILKKVEIGGRGSKMVKTTKYQNIENGARPYWKRNEINNTHQNDMYMIRFKLI